MIFIPRFTKPEAGNKYYIRKASGGYSDAIVGKPQDKDCDVLSNCVGYAYGRFNEIGEYGSCKYLRPVNAENFINYRGVCEVGQTPKLGAVMVWQKGKTLSGSDGAGHVAIVEEIVSDTEVITSESAYGGKAFQTKTRKKGSNGRWGSGSAYTFLGFIYNPAVKDVITIVKPVDRNQYVNQIKANITTLRIRAGAGTNQKILCFAKKGYYNYTATKTANGYTWYQIGEQQWIAYDKSWCTVYEAVKPKIDSAKKYLKTLSGKYVVDNVNGAHLRTGAGDSKYSLGVLTKGTVVRNYGYYTLSNGVKWLYVKTENGLEGYCSITYLKKQ